MVLLLRITKFKNFRRLNSCLKMVAENKLNWNLKVEDIESISKNIISESTALHNRIAALKPDKMNVTSILDEVNYLHGCLGLDENNVSFLQHVHTDKAIREASTAADRELSAHFVEMDMRKDVFDAYVKFQSSTEGAKIEGINKRFLERLIRSGRRSGLHLDKDKRDRITTLKKRMKDIAITYNKNCNDENSKHTFTKNQLKGLPEDFLKSRQKGDCYELTLQYPDYFPLSKKCAVAETRKYMSTAMESRCLPDNANILEELIEHRFELSEILGYPTHADFVTETRMAKSAKAVKDFLEDLNVKLQPLWEKEIQEFLQYKQQECEESGDDFDGKINMWDFRYFANMAEEKRYKVDHVKLAEYFPTNHVVDVTLQIYQELLSVVFKKINNAPVWATDVELFEVKDKNSGNLMGYFYLDLFPRDGKFSHAACFPLQSAYIRKDGSRQVPISAVVANLTKPTEDKPSLLQHSEVETFFHEFGHCMHGMCTTSEIAMFSGTAVERDFVEAPSQMLENWVWKSEPLKRLSSHYKTGDPIPDDMINSLVASRKANAAIFNLRQVALALFDQTLHTGPRKADTRKVYEDTYKRVLGISVSPNTNLAGSFAHLADGYDAQYYGYLWSEVFSCDMFHSRFEKEGIMNPTVGKQYRDFILAPGGCKDGMDMLKDFLGREPNNSAFLASKGL